MILAPGIVSQANAEPERYTVAESHPPLEVSTGTIPKSIFHDGTYAENDLHILGVEPARDMNGLC